MIPLRSSQDIQRVHPLVYVVMVIWLAGEIARVFGPGDFLLEWSLSPSDFSYGKLLMAMGLHESFFSTAISLLYFWVFGPAIFELFKPLRLFVASTLGTAVAMWVFSKIHPQSSAPLLASDAWLGFFLGAFMRRDIWGTVDTLVLGPFWLRVYSVPSYVLLFFWFFYLLVSNLIMDPPFSDAPMLYLLPLLGFLTGFAYASVPAAAQK